MTQAAIQFHLDECIPERVAHGLRRLDRECTTTHEAELRGATDLDHVEYCRKHAKVLVTRDRDFLRIADQGHEHAGIIFWTEKHPPSQLVRDIDALCFQTTLAELRNAVIYV
ncbi:hypothetical protein K227x_58970 [Rubripirellula lacrimiformis]|uniref:DUF5615 domain-containing protein n=1 Tax=Rubripirellula lacrimiformis TaxID=1930273 RepID=A0A517NK25_9BACT|nr:DUF5615 family PIN-like protein [Rubripirellula lacrimiformis]QDT07470.1 hypothetical protein K227x_58970 [Rubripirellula lacrimiformis]